MTPASGKQRYAVAAATQQNKTRPKTCPRLLQRIYIRRVRSTEGAVMRRHVGGIGCGARARASQPRTREAPDPIGGTATLPQGACWTGIGSIASSQETRTRGTEIAAMARREAPRAGNGTCTTTLAAPLGAPSPHFSRGTEGKTAYPAPQRIQAAERWQFDIWIGECAERAANTLRCRPRAGGDPYAAAYRENTGYGSWPSPRSSRGVGRDDNYALKCLLSFKLCAW